MDASLKPFLFSVVAKTAYGRPATPDIRSHLASRCNLKDTFLISTLDNVHLLLRFKCQDDYLRVLLRESLLGHAKENCRSSGEEVQAVQRILSAPKAPAPIASAIPKVWVHVPHVVHRRLESVEGNAIFGGVTVAPLDASLSGKTGHFLGGDGSLLPSSVLREDSGGPFRCILAEEAGGVPAVSSSMVRSRLHGNSLSKNGNLLALSKESEEVRSSGIPHGIITTEEGVSPAGGSPSLACPAPAVDILGIPEESSGRWKVFASYGGKQLVASFYIIFVQD
ncbi:hypothetical protein Taro_054816 [Colocasia esculenta]|uniref:Uncharacterized protein n=1 Tax=Colocasia esculenta TaxID=4460 RepID=A0A843XRS2_COLES|nr:hypothetical protein [Colocasia esculenta]